MWFPHHGYLNQNYVHFYTLCNPLHCTIFTRFSFEKLGTVHTAPAFRTQLHSENPSVLRPNHANWSPIFVPKHLQAIRIVINNRITTNYITIIIVVDNCQYNKYVYKLLLVFACLFFTIPKERNLWLRQPASRLLKSPAASQARRRARLSEFHSSPCQTRLGSNSSAEWFKKGVAKIYC